MNSAEQFQAASRAQVETVLGITGTAMDAFERLVRLNLRNVRSAIDHSSIDGLSARGVEPLAESVSAYIRDLLEIVTSTSAELARTAEQSVSAARQRMLAAIEAASSQTQATMQAVLDGTKSVADLSGGAADALQSVLPALGILPAQPIDKSGRLES